MRSSTILAAAVVIAAPLASALPFPFPPANGNEAAVLPAEPQGEPHQHEAHRRPHGHKDHEKDDHERYAVQGQQEPEEKPHVSRAIAEIFARAIAEDAQNQQQAQQVSAKAHQLKQKEGANDRYPQNGEGREGQGRKNRKGKKLHDGKYREGKEGGKRRKGQGRKKGSKEHKAGEPDERKGQRKPKQMQGQRRPESEGAHTDDRKPHREGAQENGRKPESVPARTNAATRPAPAAQNQPSTPEKQTAQKVARAVYDVYEQVERRGKKIDKATAGVGLVSDIASAAESVHDAWSSWRNKDTAQRRALFDLELDEFARRSFFNELD
ncbi:hypothetical protein POSPLADRAFT_1069741 [Postia placenta MAD-698-R-SB12]|uniref:Uncharacterized protein n=1 Tax=Postia placenta MAD-698-R-SB12 TaxID=670580 RepID=A0A1X6N7H3_9APHY|nr:hypothetical protein POSPLADRAFT_1069741 [Postia placenta MAD-698-R-SB12]OSX64534.1 hypothetical protein POSPLADRAFT_1069741 [Postia placenta MAD-698-R-SB12]